ncbi:SDR family NAD(P)-dependent oxidoreductase [Legionella drozanskii]|uniref:Acetyoacetyl CoA reductase n=1 Tax=Legionella drozanskii LLAP-1 TaxID=1212489 RepID=A0A0W0SXY9_9GAMM|nr:SDR family NAD(P)-dependent oxidoreductase [Legionella drozanskii]KTC88163.1 acetyoacetyl CoA reductase [Legionella drozanskii LLAP-1]
MNLFTDKVVVITGAGSGIGCQAAINFAKNGANLVLNDINDSRLREITKNIKSFNTAIIAAPGDIANSTECSKLVELALEKFNKIDILINNAAVAPLTRPLELIDDEEWNSTICIDLNSVFYCMRAVLPHMKANKYGKIINVSSSAGRSISTFAGAHYTTAKAGILGLTRHAAFEYAPYNININAIAPGTIDTELLRKSATAEKINMESEKIPMRRLGTTDDIYNLISFLASDQSSYINGATIDINGADLLL